MNSSLKIAILGAGSIGCYAGGLLLAGGADVSFIGRKRYKEALETHGLTLTHHSHDPRHLPAGDIKFFETLNDAADSDIIIICVKSQDSASAAKAIKKFAKSDPLVLSFQNGVSNPQTIREGLPGARVLGAVVPYNITSPEPGRFHCGTGGDLTIEASDDPRLAALVSYFEAGGQPCDLSPNIEGVQWTKLLINLNNALNTLHGGSLKGGLLQRPYRLAFVAMIEEALGFVKASGVVPADFGGRSIESMIKVLKTPNFLYRILMALIIKIDETARSSMLDDLDLGRESEIDYLQGEVIRLAEAQGSSAPVNQRCYDLIKAAFEKGVSPRMSGHEIYQNLVRAK